MALHVVVPILDKVVAQDWDEHEGKASAPALLTCLYSIRGFVLAGIVYFIYGIDHFEAATFWRFGAGICYFVAVYYYFKAVFEGKEIARVILLLYVQFAFILLFDLLLGQHFSTLQLVGAAAVLAGGIILERPKKDRDGKWKFEPAFMYMIGCSIFLALAHLCNQIAPPTSNWLVDFADWHMGAFLISLPLYPLFYKGMLSLYRNNKKAIALTTINDGFELLYVAFLIQATMGVEGMFLPRVIIALEVLFVFLLEPLVDKKKQDRRVGEFLVAASLMIGGSLLILGM